MTHELYKDWVRQLFDRAALIYGQKYNTYFDDFAKNLVALADLPVGAQVLDVATGRGAIAQEVLKKVGVNGYVVGIDISPGMIAATKNALATHVNLELLCMDAEQLDFKDNSFDAMFCGFSVFFFPDMAKALQECFRVLKPGGSIFFSTWGTTSSLACAFFEEFNKFGFSDENVFQNFKDQGLLKTLKKQGFLDIVTVQDTIDYVYPTIDDWFMALWAGFGRSKIEKLNDDQLKQFEAALRSRFTYLLEEDGLHEELRADYTYATKPM